MRRQTIGLAWSDAVMLAGLMVFASGSMARAENGAAPATECSFPCFFHHSDPAPVAAATAVEAAPSDTNPAAEPKAAKPKRKPAPVLTIAADEAESGRLKTLSGVVRGQPIKIVKASRSAEASRADFAVNTALSTPGSSEVRGAKLFTEQLHVLAGAETARMEDLRDRVVSFGPEGSASQEAGRRAFQALSITVKETPLDFDNALDGAATGDIAAVVILAPQPSQRLRTLKQTGLHLLSWPDGAALPSGAVDATIAAATYPGLLASGQQQIRAVGVEAVLSATAKSEKSPAAKRFMVALEQHSPTLAKRGFDLLKADLEAGSRRKLASADAR